MNTKLLIENWRKFINEEEAPTDNVTKKSVPGDVPGKDQVHVFDFDDTLGITVNANRVMAYKDGKPIHKTEQEAREWMKSKGLTDADLLKPNFEKVPERENAIAINLSSSGLAKVQRQVPKEDQYATGVKEPPPKGDTLLIDFTPSRGTDPETTKPIQSTINKLKKANQIGAKTAIVTARTAEGPVKDIHGKELTASNAKDMTDFLSKQGAKPNSGVYGVSGQNKGKKIADTFVKGNANPPKEIHFYDDLSKNTKEVEEFIQGDNEIPSELFIYGPGEFAHNEADPNKPNKVIPAKPTVKESKGKNIKITKSYLKQIIKEELDRMEETEKPYINPLGVDISKHLSDADQAMLELAAIGKELGVIKVNSPNPEAAKKYRELIDGLKGADLKKIQGAIKIMKGFLEASKKTPSK